MEVVTQIKKNNRLNTNFSILDSIVDSIAILDKSGNIIYTNLAWKTFSIENSGDLKKTDCNNNYIDLCKKVTGIDVQNATEAATGIEKVMRREIEFFEMEYACHSPKERRWFILRATSLSNSEQTLTSHINVTKRKLAEEAAEEKNTQLTRVNERLKATIYKISHDIQSPLSSIEALVGLTRSEENNKNINTYFSMIEKSISGLKNYIKNTLQITASKTEQIDFKGIVNDYLESIKFNEAMKFVTIKTDISQTNDFYSEKSEITSIISNIVNNSIKYYDGKKPTSTISITIKTNNTLAIISVKDNGIGIDKDLISKIFDLNFQVNKNSNSGSGIGLYMVRKSLDNLNGTITVDSTLGVGTESIITIPNLKS
jgi:signal transduction histidine kinase